MRAPAPRLRIQPPSSLASSCAAAGAADRASKKAAAIPTGRKSMRWSMEPPNDLPEGSLRFRHEKASHSSGLHFRATGRNRGGAERPSAKERPVGPGRSLSKPLKESDMRKLMLLAGAAALGLTMPALAQGQGQGRGGGQGKGQAAHAQQKGGGQGRAERGRGKQQQARGNERGGGE